MALLTVLCIFFLLPLSIVAQVSWKPYVLETRLKQKAQPAAPLAPEGTAAAFRMGHEFRIRIFRRAPCIASRPSVVVAVAVPPVSFNCLPIVCRCQIYDACFK